ATSADIAEDAIRAIKVNYQKLPFVVQEPAAMKPGAPPSRKSGSNVGATDSRSNGDVEAGFQRAKTIHEGTYSVAVRTHCSLEPHGVTCRWDDADHLTCWASTQGVFSVRGELAGALGIQPENCMVITEVM